jgi:class 3 adenylate cyclase
LGNRATGGQILLAPETALRVHNHFLLRSLGLVSLKNLSSPLEAWEVEGEQHTVAKPSSADRILVERNGP